MHQHQFRLLHFTLNKKLSEVYLTILLKTFAVSLIGLFIPIYLLQEVGLPFSQVLIYYISVFFFLLPGYIIGSLIGTKISINKLIMLSVPFNVASYILLYNIINYNIPLLLIAAIYGIGEGIFWFAYNIDFSKYSDKKHRGEEVKFWFVLASFIGIISPFLGGFLLSALNFHTVFVLVVLLLILSAIPLFKIEDKKPRYKIHFKDVFLKENFKNSHRCVIQGFRHLSYSIFWPIFVFYILREYLSMGLIFSSAAVFSSIAIWFIGNQVDKFNRIIFTDFSTIIDGFVSFAKAFITTFSQVFAMSILGGITFSSSEISMNTVTFDQANKTKPVGFFIYREMLLSASRILLLLIVLFSGLDLISSLKLSFILIGAASFLQRFFNS